MILCVQIISKGKFAVNRRNYDAANKYYTKFIERTVDNYKAYGFRGFAYKRQGNYEEAIRDYTKALEIHTEFALGYFFRAVAYDDLGKNQNAAKDYNNYLRLMGNKEKFADQIRLWIRELGYNPVY